MDQSPQKLLKTHTIRGLATYSSDIKIIPNVYYFASAGGRIIISGRFSPLARKGLLRSLSIYACYIFGSAWIKLKLSSQLLNLHTSIWYFASVVQIDFQLIKQKVFFYYFILLLTICLIQQYELHFLESNLLFLIFQKFQRI